MRIELARCERMMMKGSMRGPKKRVREALMMQREAWRRILRRREQVLYGVRMERMETLLPERRILGLRFRPPVVFQASGELPRCCLSLRR